MNITTYQNLALSWQPTNKGDRLFQVLAVTCVLLLLLAGFIVSSIDLPEQSRAAKQTVPERVAKFITEREKPEPPPKVVPKPVAPKPVAPPPVAETPKIERQRPRELAEPVTEAQKKARDKAAQSGLLAHMGDLNDLIDTPAVSAQVKRSINASTAAKDTAGHSAEVFSAKASAGSGGVDASRYAASAGTTQLSAAELASAREQLAASAGALAADDSARSDAATNSRSEEEITLVMDRQKGQLQALYNRARRANPALKGKLVLAITILPSGVVDQVRVISSELNDNTLESRIVARVKTFQFAAREVATVTVNYPIEFLP